MSDEHIDFSKYTEEYFQEAENQVPDAREGAMVEVTHAEWVVNSKGNPMLKTRHKILDEPDNGATLFNNTNVPAEGANPYFFVQFFKAHGIDELASMSQDQIASTLIERRAFCDIKHREYEGRTFADMSKFESIDLMSD